MPCVAKKTKNRKKGFCFVPVFQNETGLCFSLLCYFIRLMYLSYISFVVKFLKMSNPGDGGAWWAAVYGVTQSRTQLKLLSSILGKIKVALDYLAFEVLAEFLVKPSAHANF